MINKESAPGPIGIFDSGYGGLTVFREIETLLPEYNYIYLGDNARSPYGPRDFDTIYRYTWQAVQELFARGCNLVILACNTSSARALHNIQRSKLPNGSTHRRVLGIIRPTTEIIGKYSRGGHIGIMGTEGTVASETYPMEIGRFFPEVTVYQQACPMWVPLVEAGEHDSAGADYFVKKYIDELLEIAPQIDTLLLACTHYPLLIKKIEEYLPREIKIISQGELVAKSLKDYLARNEALAAMCLKNATREFLTTGDAETFSKSARAFLGRSIISNRITLPAN